jgi:hypothetical protein
MYFLLLYNVLFFSLSILIVMYVQFRVFCLIVSFCVLFVCWITATVISGNFLTTLTEVFPCLFLSCKANRKSTERTSHLAGLWTGAAVSNTSHSITSHSNKAGSITAKRARLTGKGSRSTAVLSHLT